MIGDISKLISNMVKEILRVTTTYNLQESFSLKYNAVVTILIAWLLYFKAIKYPTGIKDFVVFFTQGKYLPWKWSVCFT